MINRQTDVDDLTGSTDDVRMRLTTNCLQVFNSDIKLEVLNLIKVLITPTRPFYYSGFYGLSLSQMCSPGIKPETFSESGGL